MKTMKISARSMIALTVILFGAMFLLAGAPVSAQSQTDNPVVQTGEGVGKIVTSPVKIPEEIVDDSEKSDPVTGTVTGTIEGTGEGVKQIEEGTMEVIEAPLKVFK